MSSDGFDRLRRRADSLSTEGPRTAGADPLGRQALYSGAQQKPTLGAVTVDCSSCGVRSTITPRRLLGLVVPSLHLPVLRGSHPSWLRCPACDRRTWVRLGLSLQTRER